MSTTAESRGSLPMELLQPHQSIVGVDRPEEPILTTVEGSRLAGALSYRLWQALLLSPSRSPRDETLYQRMSAPRPGDAVVVTDSVHRRDDQTRHQGVGYLLAVRQEWGSTDEEWAAEQAEWQTPDGDRWVEPQAWYVQYQAQPEAVCRWTNCRVLAIPTETDMRAL